MDPSPSNSESPPPPSRVPTRATLFAAIVGLAMVLAGFEFAIDRWVQTPSTSREDPRLGQVHQPHARVVQSLEGHSVQRTNSWGLFDDELRTPRARFLALLVGDSYAEALQVPRDSGFAHVAEDRDQGLEIFNAALSGGYPSRYPDLIEGYVARIRPDVVVIQVNDGDVPELMEPRLLEEAERLARRAHAAPAGSPEPDRGFMKSLVAHSALLKFASIRLALLDARERTRLTRKFSAAPPSADANAAPSPDVALDPVAASRMDSLAHVIAGLTSNPILLYIPAMNYFDGTPRPASPERRAFWREFASRHHIEIVDPSDAFAADFLAHREPLHGFANSVPGSGHINARGHRIVGELLAASLARRMARAGAP